MKKLLIILISLTIIGLIAGGIYSFNFKEIIGIFKSNSSDKEIGKVKVPYRSEDEAYSENIKKGNEYARKGYSTLAIQAYTLANQIFPGKSEPYFKIGEIYFYNDNLERARENFLKSLDLSPFNPNSVIYLSQTYVSEEKFDLAAQTLQKYRDRGDRIKLEEAFLFIAQNNHEEAKKILNEIAAKEGENSDKNTAQKFLKAYEGYDLSKGAPPLYLMTLLAKNLNENENYYLAKKILKEVLAQKNDYRDAWILLGYSYLNSQKPLDAIDALKEGLRLSPEKPETRYLLSLAYFYAQDTESAIENMEIALQNKFEPEKEALVKLGEMYLLAQKYEEAAKIYEKLLKMDSSNIDIFVKPIWIYIDQLKKNTEAQILAEKALKEHPNDPMTYNLLGWVQLNQGNYDEAKKNLEQALNLNPKFDAAHLNLGILYEKQNQMEEAKKYYKLAYEEGEGNSISNLAAINYNNLLKNQ